MLPRVPEQLPYLGKKKTTKKKKTKKQKKKKRRSVSRSRGRGRAEAQEDVTRRKGGRPPINRESND